MGKEAELEVKLASKIEEFPRKDWEAVLPDVVEDYSFFSALDKAGLKQFKFYYLMAYDKDIPVACTHLFLMDFPLDMGVLGPLKRVTGFLKKISPGLLSAKILFCGSISSRGRIGLHRDYPQALDYFVAAMEELAKKNKARAITFKDFDASYDGLLRPLISKGFRKSGSLPVAVMDIKFNNFEEYLKSLSAVSREGFRRKLKKIKKGPQIELEVTSSISREVSRQMYGLYLQTMRNSEIEFEELTEDYFALISESMPESNKCFLWRLEGRLVAFAQCLVKGSYFIDHYLGFDYSLAYEYNFYYLRFKALLEWCIANKMSVYEIGQSSYEIKRRLGFDFLPLYVYARPCGRLNRPIFNFYHKFLASDKFEHIKKG